MHRGHHCAHLTLPATHGTTASPPRSLRPMAQVSEALA